MKKFIFLLVVLSALTCITPSTSFSQDTNNVVLELCTGTWCQYCPCGHAIADAILQTYPTTLVIEYHGPPSYPDPWVGFNGNTIISSLGMSSYPTGTIGRRTGVISRGSWFSQASYQATFMPDVKIELVKNYNEATRQLQITANVRALRTIDTTVKINILIMEDNLVYAQTGNTSAGCIGGPQYIHKHVVRDMINGALGEEYSTGTWTVGTIKSKTWNYTVPTAYLANNCEIGVFCYLVNGALASQSYILNSAKTRFYGSPTQIGNENIIPFTFELKQNFPNPFNPQTNIHFTVPKNTKATLKIYNSLGNEVATYLDEYISAGTYNVTFDGSNLPSGIYFYKLTAGDFSDTKKMMLIK